MKSMEMGEGGGGTWEGGRGSTGVGGAKRKWRKLTVQKECALHEKAKCTSGMFAIINIFM